MNRELLQQALDRKADNARELGLDYEPEQDWDLLKATQESLCEHMARIKELEAQIAKLKEKNNER